MSLILSESTAKFLEFVARRRKPATHIFYTGRLVALDKMLGRKRLHKLKKRDFETYLDYANHWQTGDRQGTPKAPDTVRANIAALEQWQKFAVKERHLKKPLIDDLDKPAGRHRERLPTPEEDAQIMAISSPAFRLVYEALRRSGARPNELARATVADWDKLEGAIVLLIHKTDKTGRPRKIAVGEKLAEVINTSLNGRTEGTLFLTPTGLEWDSASLSAAFRRARNTLELDKRLVLYTARHRHATAMYQQHGELATSVSLGHSAGMLGRYAKIPMKTRQEMQDSLAI